MRRGHQGWIFTVGALWAGTARARSVCIPGCFAGRYLAVYAGMRQAADPLDYRYHAIWQANQSALFVAVAIGEQPG